jgi:hypothetical protein
MKTNRYRELFRMATIILCLIFIYEAMSELNTFSKHGRRGVLMNNVNNVTKPIGNLFGANAVRPKKPSDMDFPPQADSLSEYKRMYADSAVKFSRE